MARRAVLAATAAVLLLAALVVPTAFAARPTFERITIDETFPDMFLTAACGFPVVTHAQGHITVRTFDREKGLLSVGTLNISLTAMANGQTYQFRDVGADLTRVTPDGSEILMIIGQIPFDFIGVLKINVTTGEVIHEPQHNIEARLEEACAVLSPPA